MGRPLKIAKAVVLTWTGSDGNTDIATVAENLYDLNIVSGMPFIMTTTTAGLTAGVTYWFLKILTANTFTISATHPSANPNSVKQNIIFSGPVTVPMTVGVVDAYFNNPTGGTGYPATNANTYSVVGGNTAIYGKQVLANVAIGVNGTGTIYTVSTSSTKVGGLGTSFSTTGTAATVIQYIPANGVPTTLGYVSSNAQPNIEISNATATGNFLTTVGNAQTLTANLPVTLTANIGNLTAGTTYFVKTIANAAAFSVSTTPGGANVALTNEDATSYALQDVVTLATNATAALTTGTAYIYANPEAGYIIRQKGKTKYLVKGGTSGLVGQCYTANVANTALLPNTMSIRATNAASGVQYVSSVNDHSSELFPATVAPDSLVAGTVYTIYSAGTTDWTAVGAMASMTGITFAATGTGSGTGLAVLANVNPDVISSFNAAAVANVDNGQPNPIVTINNA